MKLLTCVKCLGNETLCRDTCKGYYCYKYEMEAPTAKPVKRGCLNDTDPLSRVNECSLRSHEIGRLRVVENFCICTSDRCNSASNYVIISGLCFSLISLSRVML
ncbi:activin types I and II receptor domain protein [Teladorsagia circumcincta]|uniref:Activin types I and II receptor domain protein n=1 Tax=Teladorsagia circumcincta TaxID=45464 RepID=A0A2G9UUW8_TELCI|nr:activin types I and II receptor domain protein [Teladorsagia circumcincta]